jgi:ankyrin repeat protein
MKSGLLVSRISISVVTILLLLQAPLLGQSRRKPSAPGKIAPPASMTQQQRDSALLESAKNEDSARLRYWLNQKANPNAENSADSGKTALLYAVSNIDVSKYTNDPEEQDKIRKAFAKGGPIGAFSIIGSDINVGMLLSAGADPNKADSKGTTALMVAALNGNLSICQLLIEIRAAVNVADHDKMTPLMYACQGMNAEVVKLLLDHRADLSARNAEGATALTVALISESTSKNSPGASLIGFTKFLNASDNIFDSLIALGADVHTKIDNGSDLLLIAAQFGNLERAQFLIAKGFDVNARNKLGRTALLVACNEGKAPIVRFLLANKANADIAAENKQTPLMAAAEKANYAIVEMLIANKVDVNARMENGETALSIVKRKKCAAIEALLTEAGAKM